MVMWRKGRNCGGCESMTGKNASMPRLGTTQTSFH